MRYITYFDLLGTRGFCEDPDVYFKNMDIFYKSIVEMSCFLKEHGRIGIFSDCAYAESNDLQCLLQFLTELRDRLISEGLFFNAVIKSGQLGVKSILEGENSESEKSSGDEEDKSTEKEPLIFGVKFTENDIAKLYIIQSNFKGIGIYVDESITDEEIVATGFKTSKCFYMAKKREEDYKKWSPIEYRDIAFSKPRYGEEGTGHTLSIVLKALYSAYVTSPKYGIYYISILSNMIRSYDGKFKWNLSANEFEEQTIVFRTIFNILSNLSDKVEHLIGIENLMIIMLDEIYNCTYLHNNEKRDITKLYMNKSCLRSKYMHSLNNIPEFLFSADDDSNNKNLFVKYCQDIFSADFLQNALNNNENNKNYNWREQA